VAAENDRPVSLGDRAAARFDIRREIAELLTGLAAIGQRHRDDSYPALHQRHLQLTGLAPTNNNPGKAAKIFPKA
jgi:hypothetical protein